MSVENSHCKLNVLSRCDGSALFTEDDTSIMVGVYGPVESKANKALVERANVEAHFRPKSGLPGVKDRLVESVLKGLCEGVLALLLFPRTSIVVVIQELQDNGKLVSCALNAACLALLNAGIDMKFMFAAVTCFLDTSLTLVYDRPKTENEIIASFTFVFDSVKKSILVTHTEGSFSTEQFTEALDLCRDESEHVFKFYRETLTKT